MMIIARKVNERIVIGGNIVLTVCAINGTIVRLGIEAPKEIIVDREEVHNRRQETKQKQAS